MNNNKAFIIFGIVVVLFILFACTYNAIFDNKDILCSGSGVLINNQCYKCPDGYVLNENNLNCELIDNDNSLDEEEKGEELPYSEWQITYYKENCKEYDYEDIYRYAEDHEGELAKFTGKVIQVIEDNTMEFAIYEMRVNVTENEYGNYEDTIYVYYMPMEGTPRIIEGDIITLYGKLNGLKTYTSILNSSITIPYINAFYIEIENL